MRVFKKKKKLQDLTITFSFQSTWIFQSNKKNSTVFELSARRYTVCCLKYIVLDASKLCIYIPIRLAAAEVVHKKTCGLMKTEICPQHRHKGFTANVISRPGSVTYYTAVPNPLIIVFGRSPLRRIARTNTFYPRKSTTNSIYMSTDISTVHTRHHNIIIRLINCRYN